jgi:hypothetical protein
VDIDWNLFDPAGTLDDDHRHLAYVTANLAATLTRQAVASGQEREPALAAVMKHQMATIAVHGGASDRCYENIGALARRLAVAILDGVVPPPEQDDRKSLLKVLVAMYDEAAEKMGRGVPKADAIEDVLGQFRAVSEINGVAELMPFDLCRDWLARELPA